MLAVVRKSLMLLTFHYLTGVKYPPIGQAPASLAPPNLVKSQLAEKYFLVDRACAVVERVGETDIVAELR